MVVAFYPEISAWFLMQQKLHQDMCSIAFPVVKARQDDTREIKHSASEEPEQNAVLERDSASESPRHPTLGSKACSAHLDDYKPSL